MEQKFVPLTTVSGTYQKFVIEEVLKESGIPYTVREGGAPTAWLGAEGPLTYQEFLVSPERLQEAKDTLCENGIVCEVSERLLRRAVDEIVKPLLETRDRNLERLSRFIEVNNKETVRALLDETLALAGGKELLEDVFFTIDQKDDVMCLRTLARTLGPRVDGKFWARLQEEMASGKKERQQAILEILPDLPDRKERTDVLAIALRCEALEIREAAGEALFSLGKGDFGYEADAPVEDRESAIRDFLTVFS